MSREARILAGYALLLFGSACSVYSSSLVDSVEPVTQGGGGNGEAGKSGNTAGKSGNTAGTAGDEPGGGGEGGAPDAGGTGAGGTGGSAAAGASSTSGASTGGTGGNGGTAGTGGTGGTVNLDAVVDGFEDKDLTLEQTDGRSGVWYTFHDTTTGKMTPSPLVVSALTDAPVELGLYAMHITATGYTSYGSGLGVDFRAGKKPYDASAYTGIRFWAKVATGKNTRHRMQISDVNTDPLGEQCTPGATAPDGEKCEDHYGVNLVLTTEWKQYSHTFAQLSQLGWGYPADPEVKLDATSLYGLQFTAKPDLEVDLWVDQVEFY
ncbi:MAG: hypothetical protein K0R38_7805 [Polyangiaceae bacterium]|jgi:hypothetical protein|nr:hypothetical protein [Polyangiaceae bacterium]